MFGTSVFGVEKWSRGLVAFCAVGLVGVGPLAASDQLIYDEFEAGSLGAWDFEESPDPAYSMIFPRIEEGYLQGDNVVRIDAPGFGDGSIGGGIPGGICQNHLAASDSFVGLWADLAQLDLADSAHFKLFNLSPDHLSSSIAGVRIRDFGNDVLRMHAYANENDGTRVNSVWVTLPELIVKSEPLFFRAAWTVSTDAVQPNGSFVVEVYRADASMLFGLSLASLDTFGQTLSYPRFGMIEPFPYQGSDGYLDIDQIEVRQGTPVPVVPLGGFSSGTN